MEPYLRKTNHYLWEFPRLLRGLNVAREIGTNAVLLLRIVCELENENYFETPAVIAISKLMDLMDMSANSVRAARTRAAQSGWLAYEKLGEGDRDGGEYWTRLPDGLVEAMKSDLACGFRVDLKPGGNLSLDGKTIILGYCSTPSKFEGVPLQNLNPSPSKFEGVNRSPQVLFSSPSPKSTPSPPAGERETTDTAAKTQSLFARFWDAYPKKTAQPLAEAAFASALASAEDPDLVVTRMLIALDRARRSDQWQRDHGRWIPDPANWLRGRRWEDEAFDASAEAAAREEARRRERLAEMLRRRGEIGQRLSEPSAECEASLWDQVLSRAQREDSRD